MEAASSRARRMIVRSCLMACAALALASAVARADDPPTRLLVNGKILTMDTGGTTAEALAIRGDRIVAVGSNADIRKLAGPATDIVDAGGRTIIPGLIDSHLHAIRGGQTFNFESYWYDATTLAEALDQLKAVAAKRGPGRWVAVVGSWSPEQFTENRAPTVADLNNALPDNPAYVQYLYEYGLMNDKAIDALGLNKEGASIPGIEIERNAQGKATGRITGNIASYSFLFNRISASKDEDRKDSLKAYFATLNGRGVTGIIDAAGGGSVGALYDPLFALWQDGQLSLRVAYRISAFAPGNEAAFFANSTAYVPPRFGDGMLKMLGIGEVVVFKINDGVRAAPGFVAPEDGKEELYKVAMLAAHRKYPLEIHAYTNDAAKQILDVFERVARERDFKDMRWCIAHISTGTAETFARMKKLGLCYSVQMGPYYEAFQLARENNFAVADYTVPIKLAQAAGLMVIGGTDSTRIGEFNTWRAIEYHVTGKPVGKSVKPRDGAGLARLEALRLYTANAAWASFDENTRGTLEAGKTADIAILDAPYLDVAAEKIHDLKSVLTLVGGKAVHAGEPFKALAAK